MLVASARRESARPLTPRLYAKQQNGKRKRGLSYQLSVLWWRAQAYERKASRSSNGRPPSKGEPASASNSTTKLWLLTTQRHLDDKLDLYGGVEGELGDADGASGVGSSLAEDLAQEV